MTNPRWLDWNFFSGSACDHFIYQLRAVGVSLGGWKGIYKGAQLLDDRHWPKDEDYCFNADETCEVKDLTPWLLDRFGEWAAKFLLFYDEGKKELVFNVDNGDGSKRIDLSVAIDWERFCEVWNHGGISFGMGNFDPSPLSDEMFNDCQSLSWDDGQKKITVHFEDGAESVFTPGAFVGHAVEVTADRFEGEFGSWEWIFQKPDGWMKVVSDWKEFNTLLAKPHATQVQADQLQRSYDSNHPDFYQTEAKIAFEDGSALYGAASGVKKNDPFIKCVLGYEDKWDTDCKFSLPVPLLMCWLWY